MTFEVGNVVRIAECRAERARGFVGLLARVVGPGDEPARRRLQLIDQEWRPDGFRGDSPFYWATEHLRLAAPREETAVPVATTTRVAGFAVGDRVRVRAGERFCSFSAGALGTITQVDPDGRTHRGPSIGIQMDGATRGGNYGGGEYIAFDREDAGSRASSFELVSSPAPPPAPGFTQKTGPIEVGDKVTLKSTAHYYGNSSVPSSLRDVVLTVTSKEGRLLTLERPDGRTRRGWVENRFEHVKVPVDATDAPVVDDTPPPPAPVKVPGVFEVGDKVIFRRVPENDTVLRHAERHGVCTVTSAPSPRRSSGMIDVEYANGEPGIGWFAHRFEHAPAEATTEPTPEPAEATPEPSDTPLAEWERELLAPAADDTLPPPARSPQVGDRVRVLAATYAEEHVGSEAVIRELSDDNEFAGTVHPYLVETSSGNTLWASSVSIIETPGAPAAEPTPEPAPRPRDERGRFVSPAHVRDIELIGQWMADRAGQGEDDGGWCSAYDRLVEELNPQLSVKLAGRNPA